MLNGTLGLWPTITMALRWFRNPWSVVPITVSSNQGRRTTIQLRSGPTLLLRGSRGLSVPDICILHEVVAEDHYFLDQFVQPGYTVVDIGAHIGCFSLLAAKRVGSTGKVVAFEPEASNYDLLEANCRLNPQYHLAAHNIAVSGSQARRSLCINGGNTGGHSLLANDTCVQSVCCCTLEEAIGLAKSERIDLLKVDCEGSEFEIFDAATIGVLRRIDRIIMEVHDAPYTPCRAIEGLFAKLGQAGFTITTKRDVTYADEGHFSVVVAERDT